MVPYATYVQEGDAEEWWRAERMNFPYRGRELTWADFLDRFLQYYIPDSERMRRAAEFMHLVQGKISVEESPDPPESGVLTFVRSTDPQCLRALLGSGVLMPIIRSPDPSVSGVL
ncbi:hypothetical protein ACLOJK_004312, partial [Asimina triloba]